MEYFREADGGKILLGPISDKLLIVLIRGNELERNREMVIGWRE